MTDIDGAQRTPLAILGPLGFRHGVPSFIQRAALFFPSFFWQNTPAEVLKEPQIVVWTLSYIWKIVGNEYINYIEHCRTFGADFKCERTLSSLYGADLHISILIHIMSNKGIESFKHVT